MPLNTARRHSGAGNIAESDDANRSNMRSAAPALPVLSFMPPARTYALPVVCKMPCASQMPLCAGTVALVANYEGRCPYLCRRYMRQWRFSLRLSCAMLYTSSGSAVQSRGGVCGKKAAGDARAAARAEPYCRTLGAMSARAARRLPRAVCRYACFPKDVFLRDIIRAGRMPMPAALACLPGMSSRCCVWRFVDISVRNENAALIQMMRPLFGVCLCHVYDSYAGEHRGSSADDVPRYYSNRQPVGLRVRLLQMSSSCRMPPVLDICLAEAHAHGD